MHGICRQGQLVRNVAQENQAIKGVIQMKNYGSKKINTHAVGNISKNKHTCRNLFCSNPVIQKGNKCTWCQAKDVLKRDGNRKRRK